MKSIMRFFSIAALAAAMATLVGCAKDGNNIADGLTFTTTVQLPTGGKAISENGEKTFAVGDRIKLTVYASPSSVCLSEPLTAANISNDGKAAAFTFNFDVAPTLTVGTMVKYAYPGGYQNSLSIQGGTLESLSTEFDYAECFTEIETEGQLPSGIHLENQYAILKLKIFNRIGTDITPFIDNLTINIDNQDVLVERGAANEGDDPFRTHGDGPIYVAVPPIDHGNIVFTASIDGTDYSYTRTKTVEDKTLVKGHMYPVELLMMELENAATVTWGTSIINGSAGNGYGINASSGNWQGPSMGGINWNTKQPATWTGGVISGNGASYGVSFTSGLGQITRIVTTDFSVGEGSTLLDGWTQSGTTLTWNGESDDVYLVNGNTLTLTAGPSAQIVFTVK